MLPPDNFSNSHASFRARCRRIVFKKLWEYGFDQCRIFIGKTGTFGKLRVHAAESDIDTAVNTMFHAHRVRSTLIIFAFFRINTFSDLRA